MSLAALCSVLALCAAQEPAIPLETGARAAWALECIADRDDPAARELGRRLLVQLGEPGVASLLAAAKASYWRERVEGIAGLGELGRCPAGVAAVALADPQWPVRVAGIRALAETPDPDPVALERLAALLSDPVAVVRAEACFELLERGWLTAGHLERALLDPAEGSGRAAHAALAAIGDRIGAEDYARWLGDPRIRPRVLALLAEHPARAAAGSVERIVRTGPDPELRELAMLALPPGALGETVLEHVVARLGEEGSPDLRRILRLALRLPPRHLATLLERSLEGDDATLALVLAVTGRAPAALDEVALAALDGAGAERLEALAAWLVARGAAGLAGKLAELLAAGGDEERMTALIGAAAPLAGDPAVRAGLRRLLAPEAGATTTAAVRALAGQGCVDEPVWSAAARGDDRERPGRLRALLGSPAAGEVPTPFLAGLLSDPLPPVRRLAIGALAGRPLGDDVVSALAALAADPASPETAREALLALIRSGRRDPVVALLARLEERRAERTLAVAYDRLGRGSEPWQLDLLRAGLAGVCADDALLALARRGDGAARREILRTLPSRSVAFLHRARSAVAPGLRAEDLAAIRTWLVAAGDGKALAAELREELVELLALRPDLDSGALLAQVFVADPYLAVRAAAARALLATGRGDSVLAFAGRCLADGFAETEEDLLFEVIGAIGAVPGPASARLLAAALVRSPARDPLGSVARSLAPVTAGRPQADHPLLVTLVEALAASDPRHVGPALDAELARAGDTGNVCCIGKDWILDALATLARHGEDPAAALVRERLAALCLRLSPLHGHPADGVAALLLARARALEPARLDEAAELFERANLLLARFPPGKRFHRRFFADVDTEAGVHPFQAVAAAPALCRALAAAARGDAERARELARIAAARAPDDAGTLELAGRVLEQGR